MEKNRDPLHTESIQLLSSCKSDLPKDFASVMIADSQNKSSLSRHLLVDTQKQSVVNKFKVFIIYSFDRSFEHVLKLSDYFLSVL